MLSLEELKRLHDKAYNNGTITRERGADDLVFYWVTQWDDNLLGESSLQYRGEFNILRKAGRQIMTDLRTHPVQVEFDPVNEAREDAGELIDGLYRTDDRKNTSVEAYHTATNEAVVCGVGAWELYTEYETNRMGDENQVIRRRPVYEANNNCMWDPNAKRQDKSDADYVSILKPYTENGYKDLVEELTGERPKNVAMSSFSNPEESYAFPWAGGQNAYIYVTCFYHREKVKDRVITLEDPLGQYLAVRESDMEPIMDELIDAGYEIESTKDIERWQITKYIASGAEIIETYEIAGENIPVIPVYGERAFIEGEEHYEGVTRLAKDPQRLRNFQMSYLADIVSRSPRPKPIFNPEQIQGFEFMYEETGSDNNYPYYLQNAKNAQGEPLPVGPVAQMPEQPMPTALMQSIVLSREAVGDVAPANVPQDIADVDLSGKAVAALQNRLDEQSLVYQENMKHAKRRDGEVYASMASDIYDAPREVTLTLPDGTRKKTQIMEVVQDRETGEVITVKDLTNMQWDVYADIGPTYASKKEQTIDQLGAMAQQVMQTDPAMHKALIMKQLSLMDGVNFDDVRDYARKQLVMMGFKEPETEEEMMRLQQAQQNQQPDPNMLLAMAENKKGDAAIMREQRENVKTAANIENDQAKTQIDVFEAQTDRMNTQIKAAEANATINQKNIDAFGKQLENMAKASAFRARATPLLQAPEMLQ